MTIQDHTAFLICPTNRATLAGGTPPECGEAGRHIKKEWISVFDAALAGLHEDIRGDQCLHGSGFYGHDGKLRPKGLPIGSQVFACDASFAFALNRYAVLRRENSQAINPSGNISEVVISKDSSNGEMGPEVRYDLVSRCFKRGWVFIHGHKSNTDRHKCQTLLDIFAKNSFILRQWLR